MENFESKKTDRFKGRPFEAKRTRRKWVLLSGSLVAGLFLLICFSVIRSGSPPPPAATSRLRDIQFPGGPASDDRRRSGGTKQSFPVLSGEERPPSMDRSDHFEIEILREFQEDQRRDLSFHCRWEGELVTFVYEASPTEIYEIEKDAQGYVARRKEVSLKTHFVKVVGEIRSSLFEAMDEAGEQDPLTIAFAEILAWEIDFYKDVREGDCFKVVVEKIYKGDQFVGYGTIHSVEYQRGEKNHQGDPL